MLDGKRYSASEGQYLLVNNGRTVETTQDCNSEALSIFVDMDIVRDVYSNFFKFRRPAFCKIQDDRDPVIEFFECAFSNTDTLGQLCGEIYSEIVASGISNIHLSKETYFKIAEKLVLTQKNVHKAITGIHNVKRQTREELYKRALIARDFIEATCLHEFNFEIIFPAMQYV